MPPRTEQLIAATAQLMRQGGMARLRTRDVTAATGVATGLLSHYFR